jgi:hypothetical protein
MIPRNSQRIQKELRQLLLCPGPGVLAFADEQGTNLSHVCYTLDAGGRSHLAYSLGFLQISQS